MTTKISMKAPSQDSGKQIFAKGISLKRVCNQSKAIKKNITKAASKLSAINETLTKNNQASVSSKVVTIALYENRKTEHTVTKASNDLHKVNIELAKEVKIRLAIEAELTAVKTDLAETSHDLHEVSTGFAKEIAERMTIESELIAVKTDLAETRNDLSQSRAQEKETRQITFQDALTGIPNRILFEQRFNHGLIQAKRYGLELAIMVIDLDKFKHINDSYGHAVGDKVLQMVAHRLQTFVRNEDMVSRWGGDEFVCLLLNVQQKAILPLAKKMINRIAEACDFEGNILSIGASIGAAIYPKDGDTADTLFTNADRAMYTAKATKEGAMLFHKSKCGIFDFTPKKAKLHAESS